MVRSPEHEAMHLSIGEKITLQIPRLCPLNVATGVMSEARQSFTSLSCDPVATNASLGDTAMVLISLSCARTLWVFVSFTGCDAPALATDSNTNSGNAHFFTILSPAPLIINTELDERDDPVPAALDCQSASLRAKQIAPTESVWPSPTATLRPSETRQTRTV